MSEEELKKCIKAFEPVFPTFAGGMKKIMAENERLRREVDRLKSMFSTLPQEHFEKFKSIVESNNE